MPFYKKAIAIIAITLLAGYAGAQDEESPMTQEEFPLDEIEHTEPDSEDTLNAKKKPQPPPPQESFESMVPGPSPSTAEEQSTGGSKARSSGNPCYEDPDSPECQKRMKKKPVKKKVKKQKPKKKPKKKKQTNSY